MLQLTQTEYEHFRDLLQERVGLFYPEAKRNDLARHLQAAIQQAGISILENFYLHLNSTSNDDHTGCRSHLLPPAVILHHPFRMPTFAPV